MPAPDVTPGIRPRQTIWRSLDVAARYAFPAASTGLACLLLSLPIGLPGQAEVQPGVTLACVWFWSLFRPASLPAPAVFALGVLLDLLSEAPLGVYPLLLLLTHGLALRARRVLTRQGFGAVWLAFVGIAALFAAGDYAFTAVLSWRALPPWPGLFEAALAAGLYPALASLLIRAHRGIAAPERV